MGKLKLALRIPANQTITTSPAGHAEDSIICGQLTVSNASPQCSIQITLARLGRLNQKSEGKNDVSSKRLLSELGFMGPQKEQKREQFNYENAEKLSGCLITPQVGSKAVRCDFDLLIPSYLAATTTLPSVDISYAVFATYTSPGGKITQTKQDLQIIRKNAGPVRLEPSRTVSFPETSFAVRASFDTPESCSKYTSIPTTLQLNGLQLPINDSMRITETRWLVPREIKWELEETAVIVTGIPDITGHIPMSTAQRTLRKRALATGKEKMKLRYPFMRSGNTQVMMLPDNTGMQIPFRVLAPRDAALGDSTALSVAGGHVLHTVLSSDSPVGNDMPQKRFAAYLEYKLHIWLRIGEDVFDEASGDLVNRKMDEMAYTVVCPLTTSQNASQDQSVVDEEPAPIVPPSYDGVWEQPPPGYSTYS